MVLVLRRRVASTVRLSELLAQVAGLNKRFVYYLEAQGYIRPTKIRKARISRRDYSPEDVTRIRDIWTYYSRGYSVQSAEELVSQANRLAAYVLLVVPTGRWATTLDLLAKLERVREAAFVYGESADAIIRVAAPDDQEIYSVLIKVFDQAAIAGVPKIFKVKSGFTRDCQPGAGPAPTIEPVEPSKTAGNETSDQAARPAPSPGRGERSGMQAFVLLKVPAKHAGGVLEELKALSGVEEASIIYGETDIIARVRAVDQDELDDLIINRIQGLAAVESTRTFLVVGKMHWRR